MNSNGPFNSRQAVWTNPFCFGQITSILHFLALVSIKTTAVLLADLNSEVRNVFTLNLVTAEVFVYSTSLIKKCCLPCPRNK